MSDVGRVTVVEGDLLDQPVQAIVNAWNRNVIPWWLLLPQGVTGAIKKRGGLQPFREVAKHGPIPLGGAVATSAGVETLVLPFEATDYVRIPALVEQAWTWSGRVDGLVNNAGISQRSLAIVTVFEVYEKIIGIDLLAPIALTQALLPRMAVAGGGDIIAISSFAGIAGPPLRSAYSAAKAGLIGYHDSVRAETAHLSMRVLVVAPGSVRTHVAASGQHRSRAFLWLPDPTHATAWPGLHCPCRGPDRSATA